MGTVGPSLGQLMRSAASGVAVAKYTMTQHPAGADPYNDTGTWLYCSVIKVEGGNGSVRQRMAF